MIMMSTKWTFAKGGEDMEGNALRGIVAEKYGSCAKFAKALMWSARKTRDIVSGRQVPDAKETLNNSVISTQAQQDPDFFSFQPCQRARFERYQSARRPLPVFFSTSFPQLGTVRPCKFGQASGSYALYQVGTGKQGKETIHVLGDSTVDYLRVSELSLDNQKGVFDFAAHR